MEWEREKCLSLIDEYEKFPELWNPRHGLYYNKSRKQECWTSIAKAFDSSIEEVKKKMESLLGSFRREKAKGTKTLGSGKAAQEVYMSKWFAFNRMAFLIDRDHPRSSTQSAMVADDESQGWKQEAADDDEDSQSHASQADTGKEYFETVTPVTLYTTASSPSSSFYKNVLINVLKSSTSSSSSSRMPRPKRRRPEPEDDARMDEALDILKNAVTASRNFTFDDECGIFGQHVANKLRNYDSRTRAVVQQEINTVLFHADMKVLPMPAESVTGASSSEGIISNDP